ncbi:MAG: hypothetical protein ACI3V3_03230, partial [Faecousia sp.]
TGSTEGTTAPDTTPVETTTEETTQPAVFQPEGEAVDEQTLSRLQALFGDPNGWYSQALTSAFQTPEEINLKELFYRGILETDEVLSEEERTYLESVWSEFECQLDITRIPTARMEEVLQQYLGLSLEDTAGVGLEDLTYWEDADCYYLSHGDTNAIQILVHSAYIQPDGTIQMYYCNGNFVREAEAEPERMAVLQPTDDGYLILSNSHP